MEHTQVVERDYSVIGWSALLVWWGVVILVGPMTIGMGAVGTGLICLGVNAARSLSGIPTVRSTTLFGLIALVWGALDTLLNLRFELSFAVLLIVIGVVLFAGDLLRGRARDAGGAQ